MAQLVVKISRTTIHKMLIESGITIGAGVSMGDLPVPSRAAHTVTTIANGRVSTTQFKFGTGSFSNGTLNGGLKVLPTNDFAFGTNDFTIEYWYYPTSYTDSLGVDMRPIATTGAYPTVGPRATGSTIYYVNGVFRITSLTTATPLNQWSSVAIVRYQGNTKMYINGVQEGVTFADNTNYLRGSCTIGCNGFEQTGTYPIKGYMDEIRVSNIARYTGPYTPATQAFTNDQYTLLLVHCDGTNGSTVFSDDNS